MNIGEPVEIVDVELSEVDQPQPYAPEQPSEAPEETTTPEQAPATVGDAVLELQGQMNALSEG